MIVTFPQFGVMPNGDLKPISEATDEDRANGFFETLPTDTCNLSTGEIFRNGVVVWKSASPPAKISENASTILSIDLGTPINGTIKVVDFKPEQGQGDES